MMRRGRILVVGLLVVVAAACGEKQADKALEGAHKALESGRATFEAVRKALGSIAASLESIPQKVKTALPKGLEPPVVTKLGASQNAIYVMAGDLKDGKGPAAPVLVRDYPWVALGEGLDAMEKALSEQNRSYYAEHRVAIETAQGDLARLKYLLVLRGAVLATVLNYDKKTMTSQGGFLGEVLVFSLPEGKHLATAPIQASNSHALEFSYKPGELAQAMERVAEEDLRTQVDLAVTAALRPPQ